MKSVYFLSVILVLASAHLGVDVSNCKNLDRSFFTCLAQRNVSKTILTIWDYNGIVNKINYLQSFIYSKNVKIQEFEAHVLLNDAFAPEEICNGVATALPLTFNGTVWLEVLGLQMLWSLPIEQRISYVEKVVKACQNRGLETGIYSQAVSWTRTMGSQVRGSDILRAVPLWYENVNDTQNFDDFKYARFGTWDFPTMKNYGETTGICGCYVSGLNYYEA